MVHSSLRSSSSLTLTKKSMFSLILAITPFLFAAASAASIESRNDQSPPANNILTFDPEHLYRQSKGMAQALESYIQHQAEEGLEEEEVDEAINKDGIQALSAKAKNRMFGNYPTKDKTPPVDSPEVLAWLKEIDWSRVPDIPVAPGLADNPRFPKCPADDMVDPEACWWSCSGCVASDDVMTCPDKNNWGLTYDDGPSLSTRSIMKFLDQKNVKATFFIVGSRVLEYPDIVREQIAQGHHIALHTWSHAGLTTLTNHQIVAEVKWSEKIVRDATGLTMKYLRPPYGDTDNRVREILRQLGYKTVIWTPGWDTNDWRMLQGQTDETEIMQVFLKALSNLNNIHSATGSAAGPITLEHDLNTATISLSKRLIPIGLAHGLHPVSLATCLGDSQPYQNMQAHKAISPTAPVPASSSSLPITSNSTNSSRTANSTNSLTEGDKSNSNEPDAKEAKEGQSSNGTVLSPALMGSLQSIATFAALGLTAVASFMLTL